MYPKANNTVDAAVFRNINNIVQVLLIKRRNPPFEDCWAFPGGFVNPDEPLVVAVKRELKEETDVDEFLHFTQFKSFGDPGRDPRGWTITTVYFIIVDPKTEAVAGDDAKEKAWFDVDELPSMAFDHRKILDNITERFFPFDFCSIG